MMQKRPPIFKTLTAVVQKTPVLDGGRLPSKTVKTSAAVYRKYNGGGYAASYMSLFLTLAALKRQVTADVADVLFKHDKAGIPVGGFLARNTVSRSPKNCIKERPRPRPKI